MGRGKHASISLSGACPEGQRDTHSTLLILRCNTVLTPWSTHHHCPCLQLHLTAQVTQALQPGPQLVKHVAVVVLREQWQQCDALSLERCQLPYMTGACWS
jgi:hypothetical protein